MDCLGCWRLEPLCSFYFEHNYIRNSSPSTVIHCVFHCHFWPIHDLSYENIKKFFELDFIISAESIGDGISGQLVDSLYTWVVPGAWELSV